MKKGTSAAKTKMAKARSQKGTKSNTKGMTGNSDVGDGDYNGHLTGGQYPGQIGDAVCRAKGSTPNR